MRKILKKLNNQKGASITFALLLFLVCAVVGSAVLVAGTVASGRMSRIAESDQRYYAVNSAARLLSDLISEETVRIDKVTTPAATSGGSNTIDYYIYLKGTGSTVAKTKFEGDVSMLDSFPKIAAYQMGFLGTPEGSTTVSNTADFSLGAKAGQTGFGEGDPKTAALEVTINETADPDGRLTFEISKTDMHNNVYYTYKLRLVFNMDKTELRDLNVTTGQETISTALKWKLSDTEVVINNGV